MRDSRISHKRTCTGGDVTHRPGKYGDETILCPGCHHWAVVDEHGVVIPKPRRDKPAIQAIPNPLPAAESRFVLDCIDCHRTIHLPDRRARQPICPPCARKRERETQWRAKEKAMKAASRG